MNGYAPIALFVYRRRELLNRVLDALEACPEFSESNVFVFSDGPKTPTAAVDVAAVRALISSRLKPNMRLVIAQQNKGLASSIIDGVTRLCNEYGRVIVIEDDLVVSPVILTWFNNALERYAGESRVMQVSGYSFNVQKLRKQNEAVLVPIPSSWGWATWKRAWEFFDPLAEGWDAVIRDRDLRSRFDLDGAYSYSEMLSSQMHGKIDSWAIRWYWTIFRLDGLVLFPATTFVQNLGTDRHATHGTIFKSIRRLIHRRTVVGTRIPLFPKRIELDKRAYAQIRRRIRFRLF